MAFKPSKVAEKVQCLTTLKNFDMIFMGVGGGNEEVSKLKQTNNNTNNSNNNSIKDNNTNNNTNKDNNTITTKVKDKVKDSTKVKGTTKGKEINNNNTKDTNNTINTNNTTNTNNTIFPKRNYYKEKEPERFEIVVPSEINIRSGPTMESDIIGQKKHGETVVGLEKRQGWVRIAHKDTFGWLKGEYLKEV